MNRRERGRPARCQPSASSLRRPSRPRSQHLVRHRLVPFALALAVAGCTPPIRQFDLKNQALTCEQANDYAYRTLQSMGFTMTQFEPVTAAHAGTLRGTREERGTQNVTVGITCNGTTAAIDASEDGKFLGQLEFKRGFYMAFTAIRTG